MRRKIRCTECGTVLEAKEVAQEFEHEGIRVRIEGIPALVCPKCGDVSFDPGVAQKIVEAANNLFEIALPKRRGKVVSSLVAAATNQSHCRFER